MERVLHVCLVGNDGIGQTAFLAQCRRDGETANNRPERQQESFLTTTVIDGEEYRVRFSDCSASASFDRMRPGILQTAHCILACFSVVNRATLEAIENRWLPLPRALKPPTILLGLQADRRKNEEGEVSHAEGVAHAERLEAVGYLECSVECSEEALSKALLTAKEHLVNAWQERRKKGASKAQTDEQVHSLYGPTPGLDDEKYQDELLSFDDDTNPLEEAAISKNLSVLGVTPGDFHAYLRCDLVNLNLTSIAAIRNFDNLQFVNLSRNKLRSLESLGRLPFLLHIDASHNLLQRTQTFGPPRQLETCDLSFNSIGELGEWGVHKYLRELNLRGNFIQHISETSLSSNGNLRMLDLNENHLGKIENLPGGLEALFMAYNQLTSLDGIQGLARLQVLNVKHNFITSLDPLRAENSPRFRKLCVSENKIGSIQEVEHLHHFEFLCDLFLAPNPLDQMPHYRAQVLHRVPNIRFLDDAKAQPEEKVKAGVIYGADIKKREEIFNHLVPNEEFVDRRLVTEEKIENAERRMFGQAGMISPDYDTVPVHE